MGETRFPGPWKWPDAHFGPPAHRLGNAARFSREFHTGLAAKTKGTNITIKSLFAQAQSNFDGPNVTGFFQDLRYGQVP